MNKRAPTKFSLPALETLKVNIPKKKGRKPKFDFSAENFDVKGNGVKKVKISEPNKSYQNSKNGDSTAEDNNGHDEFLKANFAKFANGNAFGEDARKMFRESLMNMH